MRAAPTRPSPGSALLLLAALAPALADAASAQGPCAGGRACVGCEVASVGYAATLSMQDPPYDQDLVLPAFDPGLGRLARVEIEARGPVAGSFRVENVDPALGCAGGTFSMSSAIDLRRTGGPVLFENAGLRVSTPFGPLAPFDGTLDFRGNSGETRSFPGQILSSPCIDAPASLSTFTATTPGELLSFTAQTSPLLTSLNSTCPALEVEFGMQIGVELEITYTYCPAEPAPFCVGAPNSAGAGARIAAAGSSSIADQDFRLLASGLPPQKSALFYYGPSATQLPFGEGFRCVAGGFHRLPLLSADGAGEIHLSLDFLAPPAGAGPGHILPGSTWSFQAWYRDPAAGGAGFNLSDAIAATFCP